jgi:hypothetical protein
VGYIGGDFDCNGQKDYALIVEKENSVPAVVSFLRINNSFKTVELTEMKKQDNYEVMLTLFTPGKYRMIDPDLKASDPTTVHLKCSAIGITPFKELYEEPSEVFYWENNELRSCMLKNKH